ncbi:MAG: hypothetical protein ACKO2V_27330, partial [Snowella sp.]
LFAELIFFIILWDHLFYGFLLDQNNLTLYDVLMAKDLLYLFATIDMESVEQFKESDRIKESIRY